jgi:hypothetical protein
VLPRLEERVEEDRPALEVVIEAAARDCERLRQEVYAYRVRPTSSQRVQACVDPRAPRRAGLGDHGSPFG